MNNWQGVKESGVHKNGDASSEELPFPIQPYGVDHLAWLRICLRHFRSDGTG
jgi:hypothetical protein